MTSAGKLNGEFFVWCTALYKTLLPPVCRSRHVVPWPPSCVAYEDEVFQGTLDGDLEVETHQARGVRAARG
jgi:hypothetical protein